MKLCLPCRVFGFVIVEIVSQVFLHRRGEGRAEEDDQGRSGQASTGRDRADGVLRPPDHLRRLPRLRARQGRDQPGALRDRAELGRRAEHHCQLDLHRDIWDRGPCSTRG